MLSWADHFNLNETNKHMKLGSLLALGAVLFLVGCAQTSVQPLSKSSFKITTNVEELCGPQGARNIAFRTAAVEVIRKGGDLFIITNDSTNYDGWSGVHEQGMVVQMIAPGTAQARDALSARQVLGPDWASIVSDGTPNTCT